MKLRPVEQLVLQGTPFCNINCTYCDLSEESRRNKARMPIELVDKLLNELIDESLIAENLVVVWHSGEPLTLTPEYYTVAIETITSLVEQRAPHVKLAFDIQTNATLINKEWCDFFEKYSDLVNLGVSCDGPETLHDAFRVDRKGNSTFARTLSGMRALEARGIKYNAIAVVTRKTIENVLPFLDFFYERRDFLTDFHFNVLASPIDGHIDLTYGADDRATYATFYSELLDWWITKNQAGDEFPIRNFTQAFERLAYSDQPDAPLFIEESSAPLRSLNLDIEGNVTTFYAGLDVGTAPNRYGDGQGLAIGNINHSSISDMLSSQKFAAIVDDFSATQQRCREFCEYYSVCTGGFELIQWEKAKPFNPESPESIECIIHVKAMTDSVLNVIENN